MLFFFATQLCEDLFEKINEDGNKEELSYSVEVKYHSSLVSVVLMVHLCPQLFVFAALS